MHDPTENIRRAEQQIINAVAAQETPESLRAKLVARYGEHDVFNTTELGLNFEVVGFAAPYVVVKKLSTGKRGSLKFAHSPRFYFDFQEYSK